MLAKRKNEMSAADLVDQLRQLHVSGADLKNLILLVQEFISEDLGKRVALAKSSRDGCSLPVETLRQQLVNHQCQCAAALRWHS